MDKLQEKNEAVLSTVKHTYVSIELLNLQERPIGKLEGMVINGSLSIDGDTVVRRVLNLTFLTTDSNYKILETFNPLSINKKIKLNIGIEDLTSYDKANKIIWFPCGIYVMSKCTSNASVTGQQINIVAQDKMCLHNGEIAGALEYSTRIDSETIIPTYFNYITNLQTLYKKIDEKDSNKNTILDNMDSNLNTIYREVQGENSILESLIVKLLTLAKKIKQMSITEEKYDETKQELGENITSLYTSAKEKKLTIREIIRYAAISLAGELPGKVIINDVPDKIKTPIYLEDGKTIGFKMIKYIFPEELTLATRQPITTIYERCKEALGGNYEYFYDVEGNFIFQEIKNYLNNTAPPLKDLKAINYKYSFDKTPVQFDFSENNISTSYTSTPSWSNIKNDFYVWGTNKEEDSLIGYHLVIDDKPHIPYNVLDLTRKDKEMDWREFIVHDYDIGINNTFVGKCYFEDINKMDKSKIGNVCCVVDKTVSAPIYRKWNGTTWVDFPLTDVITLTEYPDYYRELKGIWIKDRFKDNYEPKEKNEYSFNFDIVEGDKELSKFSIKTIGRRKCPVEDKNVKQLYPTIIEDILVYYEDDDLQYTSHPENAIKIQNLDEFKKYDAAGNIYKDAFSEIKSLLFKHTSYNEQLQITCLPIYNLEVNKRCYVHFEKTNTSGFFLIKKISFNLDAQSLMNISLIKTERRDN